MIECVDLKAAYPDNLMGIVADVFSRGRFILGEKVAEFEDAWAAYCGARYAVGCASGFDALRLLLMACEVGPGSEVLVSAWTCPPTWLAIQSVGAICVPIEPDPETMLIDVQRLATAVRTRTHAILPVHLYGNVADMEAITYLAAKYHLTVIEDACQAHGATFCGSRSGVWGMGAAYSFYPTKNLGAYGDAGAVVTNDYRIAQRVRELRTYGGRDGINSRLDELQAAFLLAKLPRLENENEHRFVIAQRYSRDLAGCPGLTLPKISLKCRPSWHQYVVRHPEREALARYLGQYGVKTLVHYPNPPHVALRSPYLLPITEGLANTVLSLPMGVHIGDREQQQIVKLIWDFTEGTNSNVVQTSSSFFHATGSGL